MKKPLPKSVLLGLLVSGGLAVLTVGWLIAVHPLSHKAASLRAQTATVNQQIATDLAQVAAARGATASPAIKVADFYRLAKAMPSIPDVPDVLLELDQTAQAAGVQLQSITPSTPADLGSGYSKLSLSLSATGDFYGVSDLLYRLRNLVYVKNGALQANGRLFSVDDVTLTPAGKKTVSASLTVSTYVFGSTAVAPATTTPATTTTTSTTPSSGPSAAGAP